MPSLGGEYVVEVEPPVQVSVEPPAPSTASVMVIPTPGEPGPPGPPGADGNLEEIMAALELPDMTIILDNALI